jgi:small multidrug resistance pump
LCTYSLFFSQQAQTAQEPQMSWIYLMMAILLEVVGTTCMKLSVGFTKLVPSVAMFLLYGASLGVLTLALKKIDLNIAYATWSGLGTMLIVLLGIVIYDEPTTVGRMVSILIILLGVISLHLQPGVH